MPDASVAAIIIHYNTDEYTNHLIAQLLKYCSKSLAAITVVDNGSRIPFKPAAADERLFILRMTEHKGYAAACNAGAAHHSARYFAFLNSDLDFDTDILSPLVHFMDGDRGSGAAGPRLLFPEGKYQLSYGSDPGLLTEFREKKRQRQCTNGKGALYEERIRESSTPKKVDWITGAFMLIRQEVFEKIQGFDESYFFYFEDSDICRRIRHAGFSVNFVPFATIIHFGGGSQPAFNPPGIRAYRLGQMHYYRKYNGRISFYLLKIYLCTVFGIRSILSGTNFAFYRQLCRLLWTIPYTPVRSL